MLQMPMRTTEQRYPDDSRLVFQSVCDSASWNDPVFITLDPGLLIYSSSGKMACIVRCKMPVKTIIRENGKQCMLQKPVKNYITTIPIYCGVSRLVIQVHVKSTHLMTWLNIMARYMTSLCSQIYGLIFQIVREIITVLQYSCLVIVNT